MVTLATLPLSTVPVTVMLSDSVVFPAGWCAPRQPLRAAPAGRAQEAPDAEAQCRSRQDGRHQEHTLFSEPERPQPFPQPFEPKACFSHNKTPFFVPDLYKKMVNKNVKGMCGAAERTVKNRRA